MGYIGIMEKEMETTIMSYVWALGFRVLGFRVGGSAEVLEIRIPFVLQI